MARYTLFAVGAGERAELIQQTEPPQEPGGRKVALLVGGHSLRELWRTETATRFDEVVAVNGAAFAVACDYAVIVDSPLVQGIFKRQRPVPRKALVTYQSAYQRFAVKIHLKTMQIPKLGNGHKSYTFPRAILFCKHLCGPGGRIEIFGMDFSEEKLDVGGIKGSRGANRWKQEAESLRAVWDKRIAAVHGKVSAERLAFISGNSSSWPG